MLAWISAKGAMIGAAILAVLAAVGAIFEIGKGSGKQSVETADQEASLKTTEQARDVQTDVAARPDDVVSNDLQQWDR